MKKAKKHTTRRTLHHYWQEIKTQKWLSLGTVILTPVIIFVRSFLVTLILSDIINEVSVSSGNFMDLWGKLYGKIIFMIVALIISSLVLEKLQLYWEWKISIYAVVNLHKKCFNTLLNRSMSFHNDKFGGSLVSSTNKFVGGFERFIDTITWSALPLICTITFTVIIMWPLAPWYVIFILIFVALYVLISWLSYKKIGHLSKETADASNKQTGQLTDSITNILSVKSYGQEAHERRRYSSFTKKWAGKYSAVMRAFLRRDIVFNSVSIGSMILLVVILLGGAGWFGATVGTMVLIVTYTQQINSNLYEINHVFRSINQIFGDAAEMTTILDETETVLDEPNAEKIVVEKGAIKFDNISFRHADSKENIFTDFSLDVKPGERVGLVGVSGSGKTTLTKLLLRFADITKGAILIDETDVRAVTQNSLRENIAYVPQEASLFHRSIEENIAYSKPNASRAEVERAARLANATEFIDKLPKSYETPVGERGVKLSGGQRQRIAIARAILKDAPILVLDEATSALDSESEKLIQDALQELMKGRTSIVIAHRLSTVAALDRIIVLKDGKIVEQGSHKKLLGQSGEYAKLWQRQSGGFLKSE